MVEKGYVSLTMHEDIDTLLVYRRHLTYQRLLVGRPPLVEVW